MNKWFLGGREVHKVGVHMNFLSLGEEKEEGFANDGGLKAAGDIVT